jgi:hypothetical protein
MSKNEDLVETARLFMAMGDLLEGVEDNSAMYAIVNVAANFIIEVCHGKGAETAHKLTEIVCEEIARSVATNLADDSSVPTVDEVLEGTRTQ